MKNNKFLVAALAATTLFAACSKSEITTTTNGEDRNVRISIDRGANTRATGAQVADGTDVTFTSGYLLFTNAGDQVTMVVDVETGNAAYNEGDKTVGIKALEAAAGAEITAVPGASVKVYLIGNAPTGVAPAAGDAISSYTATVLSQYSTGSVAKVTLFGGAALTPVTGGDEDEYESVFNVKPIAARFEIEKITGAHSDTAKELDYQIDGIFIDGYYDEMMLNGTADAADVKSNASNTALYVPAATNSSYTTAMEGVVYDYNATAPGLATPAANSAWAYNLLAPTSASPEMPAIVIRLSNVVVDGTAYTGPQFLTIETFYTEKGGSDVLAALAQGNVYVLDDITFDESDLTPNPYTKSKSVRVQVTMLPWESSNIGWDL